jgi:hypothetical protein
MYERKLTTSMMKVCLIMRVVSIKRRVCMLMHFLAGRLLDELSNRFCPAGGLEQI